MDRSARFAARLVRELPAKECSGLCTASTSCAGISWGSAGLNRGGVASGSVPRPSVVSCFQARYAMTKTDYRKLVAGMPEEVQADPAALSTLRDPAHLSRLPPKLLTKEQLEIVRQSNYTVPLTKGMRVLGEVQSQEGDQTTIYTGHRVTTVFHRADVSLSALFGTTRAGLAKVRRTPYHLAKGDVVELQVIEPSSPFKSPWLELPHRDLRCLHPKVFEELKLAHETGKVIRGRVLNSVGGGYAVGIGGLVGFLPQSKMGSVSTIRALGGLKEFTIASISGNVWNHRIVLAGVTGMRREML